MTMDDLGLLGLLGMTKDDWDYLERQGLTRVTGMTRDD